MSFSAFFCMRTLHMLNSTLYLIILNSFCLPKFWSLYRFFFPFIYLLYFKYILCEGNLQIKNWIARCKLCFHCVYDNKHLVSCISPSTCVHLFYESPLFPNKYLEYLQSEITCLPASLYNQVLRGLVISRTLTQLNVVSTVDPGCL